MERCLQGRVPGCFEALPTPTPHVLTVLLMLLNLVLEEWAPPLICHLLVDALSPPFTLSGLGYVLCKWQESVNLFCLLGLNDVMYVKTF